MKPDEEDELPAHPQPADLPDDDELPPDSWRAPSAVLCIAGRGPLDEAASAMLAQLLAKHGLGSRTVDHEAVSRDHIAKLDVTGVAMACISYLEISGSPAHLRYLHTPVAPAPALRRAHPGRALAGRRAERRRTAATRRGRC